MGMSLDGKTEKCYSVYNEWMELAMGKCLNQGLAMTRSRLHDLNTFILLDTRKREYDNGSSLSKLKGAVRARHNQL